MSGAYTWKKGKNKGYQTDDAPIIGIDAATIIVVARRVHLRKETAIKKSAPRPFSFERTGGPPPSVIFAQVGYFLFLDVCRFRRTPSHLVTSFSKYELKFLTLSIHLFVHFPQGTDESTLSLKVLFLKNAGRCSRRALLCLTLQI